MAFEQSIKCCQVKRFAVTAVDDCVKVPCYKPVCKNPCLCTDVPSCCDCGCKNNCKKDVCCTNKSCKCVPAFACKDDCEKKACDDQCEYIPSCYDYDRKPVDFKNDKCDQKNVFCEQVCERRAFTSCLDQDVKNDVIIRNVTDGDCKGMQACGKKMTGRFPVVKLDSDGQCCQSTHACAMDNML